MKRLYRVLKGKRSSGGAATEPEGAENRNISSARPRPLLPSPLPVPRRTKPSATAATAGSPKPSSLQPQISPCHKRWSCSSLYSFKTQKYCGVAVCESAPRPLTSTTCTSNDSNDWPFPHPEPQQASTNDSTKDLSMTVPEKQ